MLNSILRFSIRNKLIVGLLTLALVVWGGWSASQLPIDAVPDITNNQVQIITVSPSLAAQETERLITAPVELAIANIPGIIELRSFSRFGLSLVTVVFTDETDVYWARQQLAERLQTVRDQIPPGVGIPTLAPVTTGLGEIFQYTLIPKKGYESRYPLRELRTIQDWIVRRQLLGTPGVADVSSFGGDVKQYQIAVNPDQLRANNLSITDLFTALERNNQNTGGAYIDKKPNAYFIRADGLLGTTDDIGNVVIRLNANNLPLKIRDVASVQVGSAVRYGAVTRNGTGEVVGAVVMMLKGENSSVVIRRVKAKITDIEKTLPEGVALVPFLDRTKMVNSAIGTVTRNLTEGALIVIFVLVLLLGDWRAGAVVASVIPLAMLFAIGMMHTFGVSGNLMSLGAIDFGLIVDGAVIIVEATMHHLSSRFDVRGLTGPPEQFNAQTSNLKPQTSNFFLTQSQMDEEVFSSSAKIRNSAAFGEIIILIVYLPILALSGIEGKMFRPMAVTVGFAILGAFILSLTYVPMMSSVLLSKHIRHRVTWSSRMMDWLQRRYGPVLLWALGRRLVVLGVAITLLIVSVLAFLRMGGEFIPALDEGDFAVDTRVLTGSSLSETVDATLKAERVFLKFPEVEQVVAKIGSGEIPTDPMAIEASDLMIIFKPMEQWTSAKNREDMMAKMAEAVSVIPGVTFGFQQPVQMRFNELMTGSRQDVGIKIYGDDLTELTRLADQLATQIKTVDGAKDLYVEQVEGLPQILVKLNRDRIAQYGLNVTDVNRTINTAFAGQSAGLIFEGERRYDLVVRLAEAKRQSLEDVQNLYVTTPKGEQIPLSQIADVRMVLAPNQIQRDNTRRRITVGFNVRGRDVESMVNELQQKVGANIKFPAGYSVQYGGEFQNLIEAKNRLSIAVPGALALIFMLLFFTFGSVKQSLLIFTAIPFAAIGGVAALLLRGMPFSISAGVGFIALFGVAVLNGIVLIAEFNRQRLDEANKTLRDVIVRATEIRLRPVVLTALVASLGFLPMALSNSAGAEVQKPLATVVIGGLITATLLTLIVLPVLYTYFEGSGGSGGGSGSGGGKTEVFSARERPRKARPGPLLGLLALLFSGLLSAQPLTLDQALQQANTRNATLQIGGLTVQAQQAGRLSAREIGRLNVSAMLGQYNSRKFDNNLIATQILPNPQLIRQSLALADAQILGQERRVAVSQNDVRYQVRSVYQELLYLHERARQLARQDSLLAEFVQAATVRVRAGEAAPLEQATAESQRAQQRLAIARTAADISNSRATLQTLLNTPDAVDVAPARLQSLALSVKTDSSGVRQNPLLGLLTQQITVAGAARAVEEARLKPDFLVGVFSQTLIGNQLFGGQEVYYNAAHRFFGGQVGVSFPLVRGPQRARIAAARLNEQIAQTELTSQQRALQTVLDRAGRQYAMYRSAMADYERDGLAQADRIADNARKSFRAGDIGYVEFSLALQQALSIRLAYLDVINLLNQSAIEIDYLTGI